ncbi:MAG: hypothetical protein ACKVT0_18575 [Planctomycetaceae bacterium]
MEPIWNETAWKVIIEQSDAVEFDWYAYDRRGCVAAFSSYGRGVIPNACKLCRDSYNQLYDLIASLPDVTDGLLVYPGSGRYDDWIKYSQQGLFGYDYQDAHRKIPLGQYDLLSRPKEPIQIEQLCLTESMHHIVPFLDIEFGQDSTISFEKITM